jgi:transglutaminase-like putative cysteine protease
MSQFLAASDIIDWQHPAIVARAAELAAGGVGELVIARRCFEFVRDQIRHSWDYRLNPVTCQASAVLLHGTGYCYAKSHLLVALLRANWLPAGLCYQRLQVSAEDRRFSLHGLAAVYLREHGWYRLDPRGNKPGVEAEFTPPVERLAFSPSGPGEADFPEVWPEPLPVVVRTLQESATWQEVLRNLPDLAEPPVGATGVQLAGVAPAPDKGGA